MRIRGCPTAFLSCVFNGSRGNLEGRKHQQLLSLKGQGFVGVGLSPCPLQEPPAESRLCLETGSAAEPALSLSCSVWVVLLVSFLGFIQF